MLKELKQTIREDVVRFLKTGKHDEAVALRNLLAEIKNDEIAKHQEATDQVVTALIRKQVKRLEDAMGMFEKGGREDLAQANRKEIALLSVYLPAQMSDEELEKRVRVVIEAHKGEAQGARIIGIVVKELVGVAESSRIAQLVQKVLTPKV